MVKPWFAIAVLAATVCSAAHGEPPLVDAARAGNTAAAMMMIDQGADVNAPSSDGTTALHWAIHRDDVTLFQQLIKARADVKAVNAYGATPMSEAAVVGDLALITALLKAGADVESPNADGQTALMIIARTGNVEAARLLIRRGAKVNAREKWRGQTALMWAAAQSQPEMVKELLQHRAEADARSLINTNLRQITSEPRRQYRPAGGLTALLFAARQGCTDCVKFLVEAGADKNLTDPDGVSPMLMAIDNFHFDVAAYLLAKGANPNQWDRWGRTPLYVAVDLDTLPFGGRPDRRSLDATTSLKMVELLLQAGANPNAQLKLFPPYRHVGADRGSDLMLTIGATALLCAAKDADAPAIRLLLAHGANPELPNNADITPLMAAAGVGSNDIDTRGHFKTQEQAIESIELLLAAGADINAADTQGRTPLHGAAYWGWNDVVKFLAAHNANLDAKDAKGKTAIDSAMGRAEGHGRGGQNVEVHEETAQLLQQLMVQR